jgi:DNA primase
MIDQVEYLYNRGIDMKDYEFYYSSVKDMKMNRRVIVPFIWNDQIVGYTARAVDDAVSPKYHSNHDTNYVFNINRQRKDSRFVIVCEGVFDAISIDAVAVLSNRINETQAELIERLGREVIVVPDFDRSGKDTIEDALEYGWSVSFPVWAETCKDINQAVVKYGKLFVLKSILAAKETNKLKTQLLERRFFREKKN